jgi:GPN-loop GTPase
MGRCHIQIVMGPAGSGKSTYCHAMQEHCATKRAGSSSSATATANIQIANLDPAAEYFQYDPIFDVRDLIQVTEVMTELELGPNGALLYCMEYLLDNLDWLYDELESMHDDDYLLLDCPGQIELYTHVPVQKRLIEAMSQWGYAGSMVSVFCIDAAFCIDASKFLSGSLLSLSAMIALELPHVSILTKCDLMSEEEVDRILNYGSASYIWNLDQHRQSLYNNNNISSTYRTTSRTGSSSDGLHLDDIGMATGEDEEYQDESIAKVQLQPLDNRYLRRLEQRRIQRHRLTDAISQLLDDWQMVSYVPLNIYDEDSLDHVFHTVSHCIQYGEDSEVRGADQNDDAVTEQDNDSNDD